MMRYVGSDEYFRWLCGLVCRERYSKRISFKKLLTRLYDIEFEYLIPRDANRAEDGLSLRWRYYLENGVSAESKRPCSVLEMMVALAIRCEETIMDDASIGDRTTQWFWGMVTNLGLGSMTDDNFDICYVNEVIDRFLKREYDPDGKGGLFTVRHCDEDLRDVEIWYQLCWYLDSIT